MKPLNLKIAWGLLAVALLVIPAAFADTARNTATPGTVNYVEGQVTIGAQSLNSKSIGSTELQPGQALTTNQGKAELLLTPGVFLRLADHSSAQMVSPSLTNTQIALNQGEALVEVDEIHPQNDIRITQDGGTTRLLKTGLYDFDATHHLVRVFDGQAAVRENDHTIKVKGGHELALNATTTPKPDKFDKKSYETTNLYRWSSLRSDYLAEANIDVARLYYVNGWYGPGWFGPGWYWDPWFSAYTFIPGAGIFYNPFGWGFYSPLVVYRAPLYYGGYYHGGHFADPPARMASHVPAPSHNRQVNVNPRAGMGGHAGFAGGRAFGAFSAGSGFHGSMGNGFHGGGAFGFHR
jgi:hypothetical protein